jgi:MYXO-CTERM domain-containing protein
MADEEMMDRNSKRAPMATGGFRTDNRHGCAGCATGGGSGSLALGLLVAGVLARRRRRVLV